MKTQGHSIAYGLKKIYRRGNHAKIQKLTVIFLIASKLDKEKTRESLDRPV